MVAMIFVSSGRPHLANHLPPSPVCICPLFPDPLPPNVWTSFMDGPLRKFLRHCSIMGYNRQTKVGLVNSPKKSPFQAKAQFGPNLANLISHDLSELGFFLKHFSMMEHNRLIKVSLVSFPQNFPFSTIVHFGSIWAKTMQPYVPGNYVT